MDNHDDKQIRIDLKPEVAKGTYSNLAIISHHSSEFIIDFATSLPGLPQPEVTNRIVMTPDHAKRLLAALMDNIRKYESTYGPISTGDEPKGTINLADLVNGTKS